MKIRLSIVLYIFIVIHSGCSNTRFLAENDILYTGRNKPVINNPHNVKRTAHVKNQVESITNHKVNNSLFGRRVLPPVGLWIHNYMKVKKPDKKAASWLYKTFSSQPVLVSTVNPDLRATKIENDLFDMGYFDIKAWAVIDTNRRNPRKAKVTYHLDLERPYSYRTILPDSSGEKIDSLIRNDAFLKEIRPGDQFNLNKLQAGRTQVAKRIQEKGYFYFAPEFIYLKADTSGGKASVDLFIGQKEKVPYPMRSAYYLDGITIRNSQGADTGSYNIDTLVSAGVKIISRHSKLKPELLLSSLYFKPGDIYSVSGSQSTTTRLNNLGIFKSVNTSYIRNSEDSLDNKLDVNIDLVMADNIHLDLEGDLATKSSGYFGPLVSATISHGNTFGGAERLKLGLTGGFEWQWGTKSNNELGSYSYQFGITSGLTLPQIAIPFKKARESLMLFQSTGINFDMSVLNRTAYYRMFSSRINLNYQWSRNRNIQHSVYPVYVNSVNLLETTPEFDSVVNNNIYIRKSFEEQFIIGSKYDFSYNNTLTVKPSNFFFQGGISTSGNLLDLLAGINKGSEDRPYSFLNNIYSQYLKFTTDFRYYRNFYNSSLVFRIYAGVGIPYGNSLSLPYVEQFFSGGAYSIRAFTARYLGPGSFHTDDQSGYIDQSGDIKLEGNMEFRFGMSKVLKGAIFIDAGNIWLVNEDPSRPGAKFDLNTFHKELAVGTGFGFRFDFTFFVMRADIGMPLRTPYHTDGKNWLFGTDQIFTKSLFNLAIGYPF